MEDFWVDLVLRLGFPVVVVLMMVKGWLVPGFVYERVVKQNDRLSDVVEGQVIPAVLESNRLIAEVSEVLKQQQQMAQRPAPRRTTGKAP